MNERTADLHGPVTPHLKIIMAAMSMDIGGAETHITELSKEFARRGDTVVIASGGGSYVPEVKAAGIKHVDIPMVSRSPAALLKALFAMIKLIKEEKPDIVHAHARIPAFICSLARRFIKFDFVTTAHGVFKTGGLIGRLTRWGERSIAVSEDIKDYLIDQYGVPSDDIFVTVNGIDTDKFSPAADGSAIKKEFGIGDGPVITHVSRLDEDSSLAAEMLVGISGKLAEQIPDVTVLIAGGGDNYESILAEAERVNASVGRKCVVMTGPRTDIADIVAAGDLFTGVSRAALEAMAEGKPVILAGRDGYLGPFVPQKLDAAVAGNFCCRDCGALTADALYDDIVSFFNRLGEQEKRIMGEYGRSVVFERYSVKRMADDCRAAYDSLLSRPLEVLMCGYYGYGNSGDEAILKAICAEVRATGLNARLTVLSRRPDVTQRVCGCAAVDRFKLLAVYKAIKKCSLLIFGGGSLLQDKTSTRSILYYLFVINCAERLGRKVMIYANGIGPVEREGNRRRVRKAVENASVVTLRDADSVRELRDMGVKRADLVVTADPVFDLPPIDCARAAALIEEQGIPTDRPFAAVSVREWRNTPDFCEKMAEICDGVYKKYGRQIVFIVMQAPADAWISSRIQSMMSCPSYMIGEGLSPEEVIGVLGEADFVISMRLHSLIFAACRRVPAVGIVYDPKTENCLQMLGMPSAGRVETLEISTVLDAVDDVISRKKYYVNMLERRMCSLEDGAHENAERFKALAGN